MTRRRRILRRVLVGVTTFIVVALVGGYLYARPLLLTGTGYAAHNACAVAGIAGRQVQERTDLPPNPLVPYLRTGPSPDASEVSSTVLGFLAKQTASYRSDTGCTVGGTVTDRVTTKVDPSVNPFTAAPTPTPSPALEAALATAYGDELDAAAKDTLGTRAILVVKDGALVAERYAPGFTSQTRQLGWSMAKSAANLVAGRLVAEGKVSVTDAGLRPEWTDSRSQITVDHLMRMTSGLAWNEDYDLGTAITSMLYIEPDMAGFVAKQPSAHAAGSYQQYSSGSTNLLCDVLARKAGVRADLGAKELFAPLGLGSAIWETDTTGLPVCSSYLWATPRDWAAIGQFALQDGVWNGRRLLPDGWMTASTTSQKVATTEDPGYAAGWWANRTADGTLLEPSLPADAYWASGHDGQRVYVVPSEKLVVVRLGFSPKTPAAQLRTVDLVKTVISATR